MEVVPRLIWLEGWEWECCGGRERDPVAFEVGDEFEWLLYPWKPEGKSEMARVFGPEAEEMTHWETHHGARPGAGEFVVTRVRVDSIRLVHWQRELHPSGSHYRPAAGTGVVDERQSLYRWESADWELDHSLGGWLVDATPLDERPRHVGFSAARFVVRETRLPR